MRSWKFYRANRTAPGVIVRELGVSRPPVWADRAAHAMGVRVSIFEDLGYEGGLVSEEVPTIKVEQGHIYQRQLRISFELGRLLRNDLRDYEDPAVENSQRSLPGCEAMRFAQHLLMPSNWFRIYAQHVSFSTRGLSEAFAVPESMAADRLRNFLGGGG